MSQPEAIPHEKEEVPRFKVWIDIETTGLDPIKDQITQVAFYCPDFKWEYNNYVQFKAVPVHNFLIPSQVKRLTLEDTLIYFHNSIKEMMHKYKLEPGQLIFAGKNPKFDYEFLMKHKLFQDTFNQFFHYSLFDLTSIIYFLRDLTIIPPSQSSKLEELVPYFNLKLKSGSVVHDALVDVHAESDIYTICLDLIKGFMK